MFSAEHETGLSWRICLIEALFLDTADSTLDTIHKTVLHAITSFLGSLCMEDFFFSCYNGVYLKSPYKLDGYF